MLSGTFFHSFVLLRVNRSHAGFQPQSSSPFRSFFSESVRQTVGKGCDSFCPLVTSCNEQYLLLEILGAHYSGSVVFLE